MKNLSTHTSGSVWSYTLGFVLSIALTFAAFGLFWLHGYTQHAFPTHGVLYATFVGLALLQLLVQLVFFLHVSRQAAARWSLLALLFALLVVAILVGGTLWIMSNLQHHNADPTQPFINGEITPQAEND